MEEVLEEIDANRGVTIKQDPTTGIWVHMYKDSPGVFYDARGGILPREVAKKAGFDIDDLSRKKQYKEELDGATVELNNKFSGIAEKEIIIELGGYKAIACGNGKAEVYRGEFRMSSFAMSRKQAKELVEQLAENANGQN